MSRRVAIVGAGYAGLAAGVELCDSGFAVDIFEASRTLGGRARGIDVGGLRLDNGAHILAGAYTETLKLLERIQAPPDGLLRLPLHLEFPGRFRLAVPRLPAPLHLAAALLSARGLSWRDKFGVVDFIAGQRRAGFRLDDDISVDTLLADQTPAAALLLWRPLCLAALNTPPERASAQVFLNVLRDTFNSTRAASDLLLPARDLSALLPQPAAAHIAARGGRVFTGMRIARVRRIGSTFALDGLEGYSQVIVATPPHHLARLLEALPSLSEVTDTVRTFDWEPITTCYLAYPDSVRLPQPMLGVLDGTAQWLFDRGHTHGQHGLIAAVISASHCDVHSPEQLAQAVERDIRRIVADLPPPSWQRVITERRATYACVPGLRRPPTSTREPGLHLAGDYVAGDYPATIEGAVRSGLQAAQSVIRQAAGLEP